jgi:hypothetical protein
MASGGERRRSQNIGHRLAASYVLGSGGPGKALGAAEGTEWGSVGKASLVAANRDCSTTSGGSRPTATSRQKAPSDTRILRRPADRADRLKCPAVVRRADDEALPSPAQVQAAGENRPTHSGEPHARGAAGRLNWLRAGVFGANDGIVSIAGIVVGVAGATAARGPIFTASLAGLVAGRCQCR